MHRRTLLALGLLNAVATARLSAATAASEHLTVHDLMLDGDPKVARRSLLLVPRGPAKGPRPLLVLLHGLGETRHELLGIHAWGEKYGLVSAYERLRRPPLERTLEKERYLSDDRLVELNASLAARPFEGMVVACPYTPNPYRAGGEKALDAYASWIETVLIPAARERAQLAAGTRAIGIDGVSLGGYVALEVFLRRPELFGVLGTVQPAIKSDRARYYADRVAAAIHRVGPRAIHVETSSWDPYKSAARTFYERLQELGVPSTFRLSAGPHNQAWLREVGTLEMLLWHDRQLSGRTG
ncbi:MAG TPA: hypothetical protein VF989_05820 [Polyangiaceae bacterium]